MPTSLIAPSPADAARQQVGHRACAIRCLTGLHRPPGGLPAAFEAPVDDPAAP